MARFRTARNTRMETHFQLILLRIISQYNITM